MTLHFSCELHLNLGINPRLLALWVNNDDKDCGRSIGNSDNEVKKKGGQLLLLQPVWLCRADGRKNSFAIFYK